MIPGSRVPDGMTAANWRAHPHAPWAFRNVDAFLPHAVVAATGAPRALPTVATPVSDAFDLDGHLTATHADAVIVLDHGRIVFERYAGGMKDDARHLCFSITKSLVGLCAELLIAAGAVDPEVRVAGAVAELGGTGFGGATLRALLDMTDGVAFNEDYADPEAQIHRYSKHFWGDGAGGVLAALTALGPAPARAGFAYRTPVTDVAGLVLERLTGRPLEDLLGELVWAPAGAADAAHWVRDTGGRVITSAGFACTVRDLARVGLWMAETGSPAIASIAGGGDRAAFAAANQPTRPGFSYRSGWWIDHANDAWNAFGVFGQRLHVAPAAGLVVARFGSHPVASNAGTDADHARAVSAIRFALRG